MRLLTIGGSGVTVMQGQNRTVEVKNGASGVMFWD